ncbi:MAG TPA: carbohydrate-binding protein, partial [Chitinispirillaceae bacterium]|nr:carbohydrate-binding protein [Chitinispirillaceae bacterium]
GQGNSFTNHPGPIDFKGNSYLFYHNGSLPGGGSYHRSVCVEQFTYNENGTIPSLTMTTQGAVQVGSFNPYDTVQAETICWESGVETEICSEGGFNVSSIENGDYIKVKGVDFGTDAATSFKARVASNTSGGKIELRLDSQTGTLIGALNVSGTGGWQSWVTDSCSVSGATGKHDLFLKFVGASGLLFNFNWWKFDQPQTSVEKSNSKKTFEKTNRVLFKDANKIVLEINLPQNNSQGDLEICLFDLNGRKLATLFTDLMKSSSIELPLNRNILRAGTYLISVKQDNKVLLQNSLVLKK